MDRNQVYQMRLSADESRRLRKHAEDAGLSVADYIRKVAINTELLSKEATGNREALSIRGVKQ